MFCESHQTVKRPRKVPVNPKRDPSPDDRVFSNDYNDDYDQDRRSLYSSRGGGLPDRERDHSLERVGGYTDSGYQTRERDYGREERGRSTERDLAPERAFRRDGSQGRTLDREHSPDRRYRSERTLDRDHSPDRRYKSDRTLDRDDSPDRRYHRGPPSPEHERGRIPSDRERDHRKYEPRQEEPMRRSGSRDRLERSPSPPAMPIPAACPPRDHDPLEKPLNVLLLKNKPNEGQRGEGVDLSGTPSDYTSTCPPGPFSNL